MSLQRIALSALAVAALSLAGCGAPATEAGDSVNVTPTARTTAPAETSAPAATTSSEQTAEQSESASSAPAATSDDSPEDGASNTSQALAAIALAEKDAGGVAYKIDDEDSDEAWEIDVVLPDGSTVEVKVDREGRTVLESDKDDDDFDDTLPSTKLSDAITAALKHTPGQLDDAELDDEDGRLVWKVEIDKTGDGDDVELHLDASTLEVVKAD